MPLTPPSKQSSGTNKESLLITFLRRLVEEIGAVLGKVIAVLIISVLAIAFLFIFEPARSIVLPLLPDSLQTAVVKLVETQMPSPTPIAFIGHSRSNYPIRIYAEPSFFSPSAKVSTTSNIIVYFQVQTREIGYLSTWYFGSAQDGDVKVSGYIDGRVIELIPPTDQPNATPPMVILTPTPRP